MHTPKDHDALVAAGIDPDTVQPREQAVSCLPTCRTSTFNLGARCDHHYVPPARAMAVAS